MTLPKDINILLLGESGVGKSTFINSCYNYFTHPTLEHVLATKLEVVIPSVFQITDKDFTQKIVKIGNLSDHNINECFKDAVAATQNPKVYNFPIEIEGEKYHLRFLDTPGMGDREQDKLNCELILNFLSEFKEIHGFCVVLKPNCSRLNLFLNYCLTELLSRFDSSAVDNIFFVFTNSRGENFSPGKTMITLKTLFETYTKKNGVVIPLAKENIFCFDNEGFRYAAAIQNGVEMDDFVFSVTKFSWEKSSNELWKMIDYIVNLKPHDLQKTMLINESKTVATLLSKPLCTILGVIQGNLRDIEVTNKELNDANLTWKKLDEKMRKPRTELKITHTEQRQTVCTYGSCIEYYEVNGIQEVHYRNPCCTNCNGPINTCNIFDSDSLKPLVDEVARSIAYCVLDSPIERLVPPLVNFLYNVFIGKPQCCQCKHPYCFHEQIFYKTELVTKQTDESMLTEINNQKNLAKAKENCLKILEQEKNEYEEERKLILETCAIMASFLKANSIAPIVDPTEYYFNQQLARGSSETEKQILEILNLHNSMKKELDKLTIEEQITPKKIKEMKEKLFGMKHFGSTIKSMFTIEDAESKKDIRNREVQVMTEYVKKMAK